MTVSRNNSDHAAQRSSAMHPDWNSFWTGESHFEKLFGAFSPSTFQRRFLQQLKPIEVPALALELSKVGLRRRPEFAISLLSSRLRRWENLLKPLLHKEGTFASGLRVKDIEPFLHAQNFYPETWLAMHEAPREHGGQPFELFRQTAKPVAPKTIRRELEKLHSQLNSAIQERLPLPTHEWWLAVEKLPLTETVQVGLHLSHSSSRWNIVFKVNQTKTLLEQINTPTDLGDCLKEFPATISMDSRFNADQHYCLNIYPLKKPEQKTVDYSGEFAGDSCQWPAWPAHANLLPNSRLSAIAKSSIYEPSVNYGKQKIAIHGGLSHQSIVVRQGKLIDHRACVKAMVKSIKSVQNG